jgi:hypothetical protein
MGYRVADGEAKSAQYELRRGVVFTEPFDKISDHIHLISYQHVLILL